MKKYFSKRAVFAELSRRQRVMAFQIDFALPRGYTEHKIGKIGEWGSLQPPKAHERSDEMNRSHKKTTKALLILLYVSLYALICFLIVGSTRYRQSGPVVANIQEITQVEASVSGGPWEMLTLPHRFDRLPPRTPVSIRAKISPEVYDCVYVKSVYAPAKVYLDGQLSYYLGKPGSYPSYMADPPTELRLIETGGQGQEMELLVEYASPNSRNFLTIHPFMLGTAKEIIFNFAKYLGAPMVLSLVQIIVGCIMLIVSLCLMLFDSKGQVFFWLGLFSKFSGMWFLCENQFSVLCFKNDTLLYILAFAGFFSFMVPLLRFFRVAIDFRNPRQLSILEAISGVAAVLALILQLTGVLSFPLSMYYFQAALPITLLLCTMLIARETLAYHNPYATRFLLPTAILTLCAILELFHYRPPFTYLFSSLFQAGMFIFLFFISINAGLAVKDSIDLRKREDQLAQERSILQIQTEEQRESSLRLAKSQQEISRQRHDLRHHLAAIQELSGENLPLQEYLSTLMEKIPKAKERYCENTVVNAILSHYAARCEQEDIRFTSRLLVPETGSQATDGDLCVIFANLLENAAEACGRMEEGERFLSIKSSCQNGMLSIVMENSFNGEVTQVGGRFRSSKRNDYGIGLSSVRSIAESAHGGTEFRAEGKLFLSSVYLYLETQEKA